MSSSSSSASASGGAGDGGDHDREDICHFQQSFDCLSDAVEYAKAYPQSFVASFEVNLTGRRRYIVTSVTRFWTFYQVLKKKNHYEIIRPDRKVKLFMDLEFNSFENPTKDGVLMTKLVIENVNRVLEDKFNCKNFFHDVLILDSTRQSKYSIHLIFPKIQFQDIQTVKEFVKMFLQGLNDKDRQYLEVYRKNRKVSFVDSNVYGKFQNFRLFLAEKIGSSVPLRIADFDASTHQQHYQEMDQDKKLFAIFKSSLISHFIDETIPTLSMPVQFEECSVQNANKEGQGKSIGGVGGSCSRSPYQQVEDYIVKVIQPGSYIISWNYNSITDSFGYIVGGNRFCRNIGQPHKTQRILFVFSLKSLSIVQCCFSSNCKFYKSEPYHLPEEWFQWMDMDEWMEES